MVATIFPKSFPIFEPNQVLTNTHLNELRQYLEGEDKLTRAKAIGTGIINGFTYEIADDNSSITLLAGAGITSKEGYLIHSEFGLQATYTKGIPYEKGIKPKLDIIFEEVDGVIEEKDATPEGTKFYELIPDDQESVNPDKEQDVVTLLTSTGKKGLLVFLEENDVDIKSCFTTNCDDRGKQRHYAMKPMLVIVPEGDVPLPTSPKAFTSVDFALQRIKLPFINSPQINKQYQNICNDKLLSNIQEALISLFDFYIPVLQGFSEEDPTLPHIDLIALRDDTLTGAPHYSQYFYDFLEDLIEAYNEFFDQADKVAHLLIHRSSLFRRHLMLGSITGEEVIFQRDEFVPARMDRSENKELSKTYFLLDRIRMMVHSFKMEKVKKIKITPANSPNSLLSDQPISYYYGEVANTKLYKHWNFDLASKNKSYQVLSYYNTLYNKNPNDQFSKPLNFYHNNYQCLKIEGHIGRTKSEVINELVNLRKENRLSFDIVALRVSDGEILDEISSGSKSEEGFREYNFKDFLDKHQGAIHERAILKGGTMIIIYQTLKDEFDGVVIADLSLPYSCLCDQKELTPYILDAVDDDIKTDTNTIKDIDVLQNDSFDINGPFEVDFVYELDAKDFNLKVDADKALDINVLEGHIDLDGLEMDFDDTQP